MNEEPDKFEEHLNRFVDIQLEILSKHVPLLNRMKEKYKRKINENQTIDNSIKYELLQRLEGMESHTKLCHGDFNPSNIVIAEKCINGVKKKVETFRKSKQLMIRSSIILLLFVVLALIAKYLKCYA